MPPRSRRFDRQTPFPLLQLACIDVSGTCARKTILTRRILNDARIFFVLSPSLVFVATDSAAAELDRIWRNILFPVVRFRAYLRQSALKWRRVVRSEYNNGGGVYGLRKTSVLITRCELSLSI